MDLITAIVALLVLGILTFFSRSPIMYMVMVVAAIATSVVCDAKNTTPGFDILQGAFYVVAVAYMLLFFGRITGRRRR